MLLISKFKIFGHSMEPTLKNNDVVLVSGIPYLFQNPLINDIVAFRSNKKQVLIKRIKKIKNNKYFVYGDNSKDSYDSNKFGAINRQQIIGKLIYKL